MSGLRPPPRQDAPSRVLLRMVILVLLVLAAGIAVWTAVTMQRIQLTEDLTLEALEVVPAVTADGTNLHTVGDEASRVVLLHDVDVAGGVLWDGVVSEIDGSLPVMRIDLPGFGLSERNPAEGSDHTVAVMAAQVAEVINQRTTGPVVIAGVGLGGEVGAEIAVMEPDLVAGLVLIDVDFYEEAGWVDVVEKLPWVGAAITHALETGGPFADERWAPKCATGGWCPTPTQREARDLAETIAGTTESVHSFRRTPAASQVPSKLAEIVAPVHYLWSQQGEVPRDSVDRILETLPETQLEVVSSAWKAHLDSPGVVAEVITGLAS